MITPKKLLDVLPRISAHITDRAIISKAADRIAELEAERDTLRAALLSHPRPCKTPGGTLYATDIIRWYRANVEPLKNES